MVAKSVMKRSLVMLEDFVNSELMNHRNIHRDKVTLRVDRVKGTSQMYSLLGLPEFQQVAIGIVETGDMTVGSLLDFGQECYATPQKYLIIPLNVRAVEYY